MQPNREHHLMYTVDEVAALIGIRRDTIYDAIKAGTCSIPHIRIGRRIVIARVHLATTPLASAGAISPSIALLATVRPRQDDEEDAHADHAEGGSALTRPFRGSGQCGILGAQPRRRAASGEWYGRFRAGGSPRAAGTAAAPSTG